jgi:hypothetical protein
VAWGRSTSSTPHIVALAGPGTARTSHPPRLGGPRGLDRAAGAAPEPREPPHERLPLWPSQRRGIYACRGCAAGAVGNSARQRPHGRANVSDATLGTGSLIASADCGGVLSGSTAIDVLVEEMCVRCP